MNQETIICIQDKHSKHSYTFIVQQEEFEDTKGVIRIRKSKKDRQHNGQKKKDKRTTNDLQNTTQKTKDRAPLKTKGELRCYGRVSTSCSTSGTHSVTLVTNPKKCHECGKDKQTKK
jgi:hypothetical protein